MDKQPIAWMTPGGDVSRSHLWCAERCKNGEKPKPLYDHIQPAASEADFKNFHRALCERFDYCHDERDWKRDQVSLIEHIAKKVGASEAGAVPMPCATLHDDGCWTWKPGYPKPEGERYAGWRMDVYAAPWDEPEKQAAQELSVSLTGAELADALEFVAPDRDPDQMEAIAVIRYGEGHSGKGYYCWLDDCPDEGAILLDGKFAAPPAPIQQAAPAAESAEPVADHDAVALARAGMELHPTGSPEYIVCAELVRVAEAAAPVPAEPVRPECHGSGWIATNQVEVMDCPNGCSMPTAATADAQGDERAAQLQRAVKAEAECARLNALINNPQTAEFLESVRLEAAHQRERWGDTHDRSKSAENWYWLVGYLAGKCLRAHIAGDKEKALHHSISTAAALAQWYEAIQRDSSGVGIGQDLDLATLAAAKPKGGDRG